MKKRYFAIPALIVLILMSTPILGAFAPVRPFIQLPGEVYPGTEGFMGGAGWTNTFSAAILGWVTVLLIVFSLRARSRTADEVPTGFYNFFEMVIEGAYGFAEGIAGPDKVKDFFKFFMTYILIILVSNWWGLIPGVDSVGLWENKPHFYGLKETKAIKAELETLYVEGGQDAVDERLHVLEHDYHLDHHLEAPKGKLTEESAEYILHGVEHEVDLENIGDMQNGILLQNAERDAEGNALSDEADWTIVPFFRPAATDINFTIAYALMAMIMVQFYGFKYLGAREYLGKFFPFIMPGFGASINDNPIKAIDPAVGLLELVSEISKIISFAFRLLGNIFAGMVLLFVMSALVPVANVAFFGLEFFVGLIQAAVFALLMLIFMSSATESHHGDDHH